MSTDRENDDCENGDDRHSDHSRDVGEGSRGGVEPWRADADGCGEEWLVEPGDTVGLCDRFVDLGGDGGERDDGDHADDQRGGQSGVGPQPLGHASKLTPEPGAPCREISISDESVPARVIAVLVQGVCVFGRWLHHVLSRRRSIQRGDPVVVHRTFIFVIDSRYRNPL